MRFAIGGGVSGLAAGPLLYRHHDIRPFHPIDRAGRATGRMP